MRLLGRLRLDGGVAGGPSSCSGVPGKHGQIGIPAVYRGRGPGAPAGDAPAGKGTQKAPKIPAGQDPGEGGVSLSLKCTRHSNPRGIHHKEYGGGGACSETRAKPWEQARLVPAMKGCDPTFQRLQRSVGRVWGGFW